jgi:ABC-type proline/glycine betaine transport system substrate-binding protein
MKSLKTTLAVMAFTLISGVASAQYSMDSDGKTIRNSSNSSVGKIDSDGKTIRNSSNSSVGHVDSDGKTIRNSSNSAVLKVDGNDIRNSSNSTIAKMSDVTSAIKGAKPEAVYVALWWFIVKGNK